MHAVWIWMVHEKMRSRWIVWLEMDSATLGVLGIVGGERGRREPEEEEARR
jgi:hypothetical protein